MLQMPISGTIYNMMNTQKLQLKWQQRRNNPNMEKGNGESTQIQQLRRNAEQVNKSNIIATIDGKLKAGGELSSEELDYLRENCPELYKEATEVATERKQYRKALKNCKTKEDVERLNTNRMQSFMSQAKAINSNPNISLGKKLELMDKITRRLMGVKAEHLAFTQTPRYTDLPQEEEIEDKKAKKKEQSLEEIAQDNTQELLYFEKELEESKNPFDSFDKQASSEDTDKPSEPAPPAKPTVSHATDAKPSKTSKSTVDAHSAASAPTPVPDLPSSAPMAPPVSISLRA